MANTIQSTGGLYFAVLGISRTSTDLVDGSVITATTHDFFQPQPVKGSRAYFMHAATDLLRNTRNAIVKGYSKLFIYDIVLPPTGASISQATIDVNIISLLSASERTKSQWEALLGGAGFRIVKFWPDPQEYEMLIKAEIA
ncbi:hypothetical protein B0T24DRAFT_674822 [Lasiosphaeria ovina]|uniref:O-methyltransferase domain-containing protein n=1 Tax=Lasiosphaeria ovina TaxID=92902 RepID=A0AAE0KM46_9PEZI|nr:hypothetical protein B0T24DRAFT_674822 [Lasiosphaeria ovina]